MNAGKNMDEMSADELKKLITEQQILIAGQSDRIAALENENKRLLHTLFGQRSEKLSRIDEEQQLLFNEIEANARSDEEERADLEKEAPLFVQSHVRKKPGRRPLPAFLVGISFTILMKRFAVKAIHSSISVKMLPSDSASFPCRSR